MQCFYPHCHPWRTSMPGHDAPHGVASDQWLMSQQKGYSNRSILIYWSSLISHHPGLLNWQMVARPFAGWVIAPVRWQYLAGWHKVLQKAACPESVSDVVCCCPTVRFMGVGINGGNGVASLNITPRKPLANFLLPAPEAVWCVSLEVSNGPVPLALHLGRSLTGSQGSIQEAHFLSRALGLLEGYRLAAIHVQCTPSCLPPEVLQVHSPWARALFQQLSKTPGRDACVLWPWAGGVQVSRRIWVCLTGGMRLTLYGWVWEEGLPALKVPGYFSSQASPQSCKTLEIQWDQGSLGKVGWSSHSSGLNPPFSELFLRLGPSESILSLLLPQDPCLRLQVLNPQIAHCRLQLCPAWPPGKPHTPSVGTCACPVSGLPPWYASFF